jgi:hypothetical protein
MIWSLNCLKIVVNDNIIIHLQLLSYPYDSQMMHRCRLRPRPMNLVVFQSGPDNGHSQAKKLSGEHNDEGKLLRMRYSWSSWLIYLGMRPGAISMGTWSHRQKRSLPLKLPGLVPRQLPFPITPYTLIYLALLRSFTSPSVPYRLFQDDQMLSDHRPLLLCNNSDSFDPNFRLQMCSNSLSPTNVLESYRLRGRRSLSLRVRPRMSHPRR